MKLAPGIQPYVAAEGPALAFAAAPKPSGAVQLNAGGAHWALSRLPSVDGGPFEQTFDAVIGAMESSGSAQASFQQAAPGLIGGCLGFGYQVVKLKGAIRDRDAPEAWRARLGALVHSLQFTAHTFGKAHPAAHALLVGVADNAGLVLSQFPSNKK